MAGDMMFCLMDLYTSLSLTCMAIATDRNLTLLINEFEKMGLLKSYF